MNPMRSIYLLFCSCLLFIISACDEPAPNSNTNTTTTKPANTSPAPQAPAPLRDQHDCSIPGKVLDDNQYWNNAKEILVCISADSSTFEEDFGDSHRIWQVWDTKSCESIHQEVLPVNNSPDFPYYLAGQLLRPESPVICTQGFDFTFCYDLVNRRALPRLQAEWLNEREAIDAQSGLPMGLQLMDHCLIGYARDYGAFAFDIKNTANPSSIPPAAEYPLPDSEDYSSLFFVPTAEGTFQAVLPTLDDEGTQLLIKPLLDIALPARPDIPANVRNNRFIVWKTTANQHLAIDMQEQKLVDLPEEVAGQAVQAILKYLRSKG